MACFFKDAKIRNSAEIYQELFEDLNVIIGDHNFWDMNKKTLVLGASPNPARYGFIATAMLNEYKHDVVAFGIKRGLVNEHPIVNELPADTDFDTVTLYLNPQNQEQYQDYIIGLRPKRVVFNPGTENPEFEQKLRENGINPLEACTLVLLRTGQY